MNDGAYIEGLAEVLRHNLCGQPSVEAIINDVKDWHREQGLRVVESGECTWRIWDESAAAWQSDCGIIFEFTHDGPEDNRFNYCYNCGKSIKTVRVDAAKGESV